MRRVEKTGHEKVYFESLREAYIFNKFIKKIEHVVYYLFFPLFISILIKNTYCG